LQAQRVAERRGRLLRPLLVPLQLRRFRLGVGGRLLAVERVGLVPVEGFEKLPKIDSRTSPRPVEARKSFSLAASLPGVVL
jgi:hypothetical protein